MVMILCQQLPTFIKRASGNNRTSPAHFSFWTQRAWNGPLVDVNLPNKVVSPTRLYTRFSNIHPLAEPTTLQPWPSRSWHG